MKESRKSRWILAFGILLISMSLLIFLNLCIGSVRIPLKDTLKSLGEKLLPGLFSGKGAPVEESFQKILWNIRMPRTMAALILGGALSLSGYLLQTFFHNPIAGPFVLGISSGAKLVVAVVMIWLIGKGIAVGSWGMILAGFHVFHGIRAFGIWQGQQYVHAGGQRRDDRLYLLSRHRADRDLCR